MKKRTWMAVALAAAVFGFAGAGSVARADWTGTDTNLFEIVSAQTDENVYVPGDTAGDAGVGVILQVKCNLPVGIPTGIETDNGMINGLVTDSDYVMFRLAVDASSNPWPNTFIFHARPVYVRAEDCQVSVNPASPPGQPLRADPDRLVNGVFNGNFLCVSVKELREWNGMITLRWTTHQLYPSNDSYDWVTQCLLQREKCLLFIEGALVANPGGDEIEGYSVLRTALPGEFDYESPEKYTACLDWETSEPVELPATGELWPREPQGTLASLTAARRWDGTLGFTYTTLGNAVDTNAFPVFGKYPDAGHWVVQFVYKDRDGVRHRISPDSIQFTGQTRLEKLTRTYEGIVVTRSQVAGGYVVTRTGETKTLTYGWPGFALPTGPTTVEMSWDDHLANGTLEAWVYFVQICDDSDVQHEADLSDYAFASSGDESVPLSEAEYQQAQLRTSILAAEVRNSPMPFGVYLETSTDVSADPRAIDLLGAINGKEPILEVEGLTTLVGFAPNMGGLWRMDGEELFGNPRETTVTYSWTPDDRGMHVVDFVWGDGGVAGKVAVWFDEPRWAPLPGAGPNDPVGAKAVSLYPWTNAVSIDVALDAMDTNRPVWITGKWITKTDGHIDQDQWQDAHYLFMEDDPDIAKPEVWASAWETVTGYTPMRLLWDTQDELGSGKRKKEAELILGAEWAPLRYSTWNTRQYLIVDVSGGPDAEKWPVTVRMFPPDGGWTNDVYRTDKIVLRRIEAGDFTMGSPTNEPYRDTYHREDQHTVRLTEAYYIGIFEVTQAQWEHVMGEKPPCYNAKTYSDGRLPVWRVSYDDIRGADRSQNWPTNMSVDVQSFFGRLREKADGFAWDLPTEAQWECACRSGTQTAWGDGSEINLYSTSEYGEWLDDSLAKLGRYTGNRNDGVGGYTNGPTVVGSYKPNKWGIYDMHGNVAEWTRDRKTSDFGDVRAEDGAYVDPKGGTTGRSYAIRGGSFARGAEWCRAAWRWGNNDDTEHDTRWSDRGFRIGAFVWPFGLDWDGPHENCGDGD